MIKWQPYDTGSQLMRIRIRSVDPTALPLTCSIYAGSGETWVNTILSCSVAEYDTNDFLNLSASMYQPENTSVRIEVYQVSGSVTDHRKLFQGNITFLSESATTRTSEPFVSYTGSVTEYIIY